MGGRAVVLANGWTDTALPILKRIALNVRRAGEPAASSLENCVAINILCGMKYTSPPRVSEQICLKTGVNKCKDAWLPLDVVYLRDLKV